MVVPSLHDHRSLSDHLSDALRFILLTLLRRTLPVESLHRYEYAARPRGARSVARACNRACARETRFLCWVDACFRTLLAKSIWAPLDLPDLEQGVRRGSHGVSPP